MIRKILLSCVFTFPIGLFATPSAYASCGAAFCTLNTHWETQGAWTDSGMRLDLRYARTCSLWTDIKILLATPGAVTDAGAETGLLRELEAVHARLIAMHLEKDLRSARVVRELRPQL